MQSPQPWGPLPGAGRQWGVGCWWRTAPAPYIQRLWRRNTIYVTGQAPVEISFVLFWAQTNGGVGHWRTAGTTRQGSPGHGAVLLASGNRCEEDVLRLGLCGGHRRPVLRTALLPQRGLFQMAWTLSMCRSLSHKRPIKIKSEKLLEVVANDAFTVCRVVRGV